MYSYTWYQWLTFFYLYCFAGWIFESAYVSILKKRLVNRGFLRLPLLPLYGTGAVMMLWVSLPFEDNLLLVYLSGVVAATILEYVTGWTMERLFKMKYWDYSDQPFNLFGFVCLKNCLAFGVASVPGVYWAFPLVNNFINWFDRKAHKLLNALTAILFVVYMTIQVMFVTGNPPSKVFNLPRPYFDIGGVCEEDGPCPPPKEKLSGWPK